LNSPIEQSALAGLKKAITEKQSGYFVGIIESYLLQNNHRVHMELSPDESLAEQMIKEEKEKVQYFQANLKPPEFNAIKEKALHLKQVQETSDPPSVVDSIPHLEISDMDPSGAEYDLDVIKDAYRSSTMLTKHVAHGSNGIAYIDVGIDVSRLDYNDMQLLPFVVSMLHENDSKTYTRQDLDTMIGMHTGGITIGLEILPVFEKGQTDFYASDNKKIRSILFFRGKCIAENTSHLLSLIKELAQNGLPVTKDKAIQILERKISGYKASMSSRGHSFSVKRLRSRYGTESFLLDKLSGIRQLQYLNSILDIANSEWEVVESKISNVMKSFSEMRSTDTIINLTGDTETLERIDGNVEDFVKTLKNDSNIPNLHNFHEVDHPWMEQGAKERSDMALDNEGIPISSRVSYVGEGGLLFDEGEKIGGGNAVAMQYLKKGYLWEKVRAKNGAYGVAAAMGQTDGTIFMVSYRDPQLYETISIYDEAGNYLKDELGKNSITEQAVRTAIIGSIGSLNASSLPPGKAGWLAFRRYLGGSTKVLRQKWRDEILSTTLSDFEDFAKRLQAWKNKSIAVLASESAIAEAGKKIPFEILNV
jgi:Zn-dependent M16 (insulinase) family peptidase